MDLEEQRLFADSLRQSVSRNSDTDAALREVGWQAALADDPPAATRVVFSLLGELNHASSALDDVLAHAIGLEPSDDRAFIFSALGGYAPPATYNRAELTIEGLASRRGASARQALVVIHDAKQPFLTRLSPGSLEVRAVEGMDPDGGWHSMHGQVRVSELKAVDWEAVVTAGQLALAQQLTAASRAMLNLARDHAINRNQFGRPIASFQAVRHKLAESLVAVESAEAALDAGWDEPNAFTAKMAKLIAGTTSKTVAKHAQQVLAGMGFTSEHPFHHYLKRTLMLDQLFGSSATLRREVGQSVIDSRAVPPLLPL